MANKKNKVNFLCSACGDDFPKWHGQCPSCKEWGTLSEFKVLGNKNIKRSKLDYRDYKPLNDILDSDPGERITTNITEADRVLGGGLLPGSLLLLGGSPGVGKSTLALHICSGVNKSILYVSAEESEEQVAIRAKRINVKSDNLHLSSENDLNGILTHIDRISPALVIIDSIQTIINSDLDSLPGSPSQIRDCGQKFLEVSKHKNVIIISDSGPKSSERNKWSNGQLVAQLKWENSSENLLQDLIVLRKLFAKKELNLIRSYIEKSSKRNKNILDL